MLPPNQAETIVDLEGSVSKALAKENAMQDALDHLQRELDQLEEENAKLRRAGNGGVERPGELAGLRVTLRWEADRGI